MLKTYPPEANQALSKIQQEFTRKIDAEEKKSAQMRGELDQYEKLGQSFDNIAEKYAKVLQEIQHQTWMLDTINNENKNENSWFYKNSQSTKKCLNSAETKILKVAKPKRFHILVLLLLQENIVFIRIRP